MYTLNEGVEVLDLDFNPLNEGCPYEDEDDTEDKTPKKKRKKKNNDNIEKTGEEEYQDLEESFNGLDNFEELLLEAGKKSECPYVLRKKNEKGECVDVVIPEKDKKMKVADFRVEMEKTGYPKNYLPYLTKTTPKIKNDGTVDCGSSKYNTIPATSGNKKLNIKKGDIVLSCGMKITDTEWKKIQKNEEDRQQKYKENKQAKS